MCFSVWTILKDQWKGSVMKGLYVSRRIVSWEARFQPSCRKTERFQSVHFHSKLLRRKIFCNFCIENMKLSRASTQPFVVGSPQEPFLCWNNKTKKISSVSQDSFLTWGGGKNHLTSLWFTFYCFSAVAGKQQFHGVHGIAARWPFPLRPSVGGLSQPRQHLFLRETLVSPPTSVSNTFVKLLWRVDILFKYYQIPTCHTQTNHANSEPIREVEALKVCGDIWKYKRVGCILCRNI